jgi:hypothetical protein
MSLDLLSVQDEIIAKLKELAQDVYETSVPEGTKLRFGADGNILPYIVVEFSDMYESGASNGILSSKYDSKVSYIIVSCVGPTERSVRQVAGLVREKLTGFTPNDAGELKPTGGASYTSSNEKTSRYISDISFTFLVNTVW